ncbi:MAG: 2-hydroxyacid dehydrogenase [Oscillospiraceae bacterium]|nr:2-hydroxyacid dehydrogenase [Oscillospiraceae bacterium]
MKKIAFFDTKPYDRKLFSNLSQQMGYDITFIEHRLTPETVSLADGHDATCSFVNDEVSAPVLEQLHKFGIGVVLLRCAGFDSVDLKKAAELGIKVLRVPSYSPAAVAEHAIALLQTVNRKTHIGYNRTTKFNFNINGLMGTVLDGKTAGVVGTGKIGKIAARILQGFGMNIIAYDIYKDLNSGLHYVELDELLAKSDVITLHVPLTPENNHMINKDSIAKMKDGVILINTSRGGLINTNDLLDAVKAGKFRGVGLDVCEKEHEYFFEDRSNEIMADDAMLKIAGYNNIVLTGHQAFFTEESMGAIAETTLQNFKAYLAGEKLVNEVK